MFMRSLLKHFYTYDIFHVFLTRRTKVSAEHLNLISILSNNITESVSLLNFHEQAREENSHATFIKTKTMLIRTFF